MVRLNDKGEGIYKKIEGSLLSDGVIVIEVGVLFIEPQHLLKGTGGVQDLILGVDRLLYHDIL